MRFLLFLLLSHITLLSLGQSARIDSLKQLIDQERNSKRKVELLNSLTFSYFDSDIEKANNTSQQALEFAHSIGDKHGEAWALAYRGIYYFLSGVLPEANDYFNQSLKAGKILNDINLQIYSITQLGNVVRDKGQFDSALQFYKMVDKISLQDPRSLYRSSTLISLGRYYLMVHKPDSALEAISKALTIREQLKDSVLLADAWILMGNCFREKGDSKKGEWYYKKVLPLFKKDQIIAADYLQNMGEIHFRNGDFPKALEVWNQVLNYYRKYQYKYDLANLLLRMGTVFEQQGYYDLAVDYFVSALKISEKANYQYLNGLISHEQSWVYYRAKNLDLALSYNRKAISIFKKINAELELAGCWDLRGLIERSHTNFDSAYYYFKKSLDERMRLGDKMEISSSLFNTGDFFIRIKKYKLALPYLFKGLAIDETLGDNYGRSLYYNRIGKIYTELSVFDSAKIYLDKSMEVAIPTSANEIFRDNYIDMAAYYEKLGRPLDALTYYKRYANLSDSIFSKQTAQSLASYRALYDVERNEQKIELLNKDNELGKALVQKQKIILYSAITGAVIFFVLAGFYFRFNRSLRKLNFSLAEKNEEIQVQSEELQEANEALSKLNRAIAEQKEEIQAQAEELMESNQTISGINEQLEERIEARTAELKEAFKELDTFFYRSSHDFRRPLTTFMGLAEVARVVVKDPAALELFEKVNENAHNLDKMLRKLQSISDVDTQTLLYKEVFLKDIFEIELDDLKNEMDRKKIKTILSVKLNNQFYSYGALIKIIVQNLLENSVYFCSLSFPLIHLSAYENGNDVVIEMRDNGLGIEPEYIDRVFEMYFRANENSKGNGLGLYIVKKTVQKLNGRVMLESAVGKGTTVKVYLPHRLDLIS